MFRTLLGHFKALWGNISKSYLYFNALSDPKCLQIVLYEREIHNNIYINYITINTNLYTALCVFQYIQTYIFHIHVTQSVYIPMYTNLCISHSYNTICKHWGSHNALTYR